MCCFGQADTRMDTEKQNVCVCDIYSLSPSQTHTHFMRMCPVSPALLLKGLRDFDNVLENKGNIVKLL